MKIGMKCKVDSTTEIGKEPIQVTVDGTDFILVPSEDGLLKELSVIVGLANENGFISNISPSREITVDYDKQISDKLIDMIQYIDASLSFLFGVIKIYWEERETSFIAESEEEQRNLDVMSYSLRQHYPEQQRIRLTADVFKDIIQRKSKDDPLKIVMLFHREGIREFHSLRYIQAFYNFYFILEDLYGEGKTQNREIEQKFKANQTLRIVIQDVLDTVIKPIGNHLQNIQNFLREENKSFDVDGIIELIVRVRGQLHHYSRKSTKRKGTPLNQKDFESMAYLLMGLTVKCIIEEQFR
jgi:hypothetical protein